MKPSAELKYYYKHGKYRPDKDSDKPMRHRELCSNYYISATYVSSEVHGWPPLYHFSKSGLLRPHFDLLLLISGALDEKAWNLAISKGIVQNLSRKQELWNRIEQKQRENKQENG